jgi:hypothetical protein
MNKSRRHAPMGSSLNAPGDTLGVSFSSGGPSIGTVRLLENRNGVLSPRPIGDLEYILGLAFDRTFDVARYVPALNGIARALNAGDIGQAMLRVQLLNLPSLPDEAALRRAAEAEDLLKASPDDPIHPGYPQGDPYGRGGQFRPKGAGIGEEAAKAVEKRLQRLIARRAFRAGLRKILTGKAALRAGGELLSNVAPFGPAEVGDALAVEQGAEILAQAKEVGEDAEVALEFVKKGPYDLEDLYVSKEPEGFDSFAAFKKVDEADSADLEKRFGSPEPGYEYHHLAEQSANGRALPPRELNSTTNIIKIPKLLHEEINAEYSMMRDINGVRQSLRQSLNGKNFEELRAVGVDTIRRLGLLR